MEVAIPDKVALVTGGTGGIGEAISRSLAEAGAKVALHYNRREKRARELVGMLGNESRCFQADLSIPRSAAELFDDVVEAMGRVDVLVNNAGIFRRSPADLDFEKWLDDWNATIAVNMTSAGILCHAAINHFKEYSGGRIVNIASRAAFRGETEEYLAYAASKGGLVSLSRSIARSFGKYGIKSFVIAPGFVRTRMYDDFLERHDKGEVEGELSLKEITEPGDIAPVVTLIASGKMDHATGCTIDINAGSYMH